MSRFALCFAALLLALPCVGWSLNVVVNNQNTGYPDSEVYFSFRDADVTGTINGQPLVRDQCYPITAIGSGIDLQNFSGGRIYFSLGAALTGTGDPEPINPTVANYGTRFDKIEMTYSQSNPSGVSNLTAIDYFAIPLAIKTYAGSTAAGTPLATLTYDQPGDTIAAHLAALTGNNSAVLLYDSQGNFLRVLGPTLSPSGAYPTFQPYISSVQASGQATQIKGLYSRAGGTTPTTTQDYQFTATFDSGGSLDLAGGGSSYAGGPSVGPNHLIVIQAADLALGIYSANPNYTVDGTAADIGDNDVYSAVVRDILTGFALGFVDSTTIDPSTGIALKDETSDNWWSSSQAFGFLQNNPTYYDQYAAYLQTISSAYGYPFSDRWQTVQAGLNPATVGTMEIDVLPDGAAPVITSLASATAKAADAFDYQITASNSPTSFAATGLPAGLTLNSSTGLISGMPTATGVFTVNLSAVNAIGTGSLTLTLTVDDTFDAWQAANFTAADLQKPSISGPLGDATGAGIANLLKYALGIAPKQPDVAGLPAVSVQKTGGTNYLTLTYTYDPLAAGVTLTVQISNDLHVWNSGATYTTEVSRTSNPDGTQTVVTRSNTPAAAGQQFMRLGASLVSPD